MCRCYVLSAITYYCYQYCYKQYCYHYDYYELVHLHQHTRAARAVKSANMVSAIMVSILPRQVQRN